MTTTKRLPLLPDRLVNAVRLANFAARWNVEPRDVADLINLAHKAFKAGERNCNLGTDDSANRSNNAADRLEVFALNLGFGLAWYGLWPTLTRDGKDIELPSI